jgi:hypothetical protein
MQVWNPIATFTRPNNAVAYSTGQLVANNTAAASVVPMAFVLGNRFPQGMLRLTRVRLQKSGVSITNAAFRVMLFQALPVITTTGDGGVFANVVANSADWLGNLDVTSMLAFTDGAAGTGSFPAGSEAFVKCKTGATLYALLMAQGAYTPLANEVFNLTLEEVDAY